ncbi:MULTISPECIES: acyl-CoA thioesterase [Nocardia]|uniref:acyl-CoA thioesterase n=1 Tax=Nocardia TaxID=1817 RepID=UPI000D6922F4|nr:MULTISPECIES: acyl-CoA thioesterase [Nocardia]
MTDSLSLESYPCHREISLIFADIDAYDHVNNVAITRFFEEGRVSLHRLIDESLSDGVSRRTVLVHLEIDYLAEVNYPGEVRLGIGVQRIGRSSIEFRAGLFQEGVKVAASCSVDVNTADGCSGSVEPSEEYRAAARELLLPGV